MSYGRNKHGHIARNKSSKIPSGVHKGKGKSWTLQDEANREALRYERLNDKCDSPSERMRIRYEIKCLKEEIAFREEQNQPVDLLNIDLLRLESLLEKKMGM